MSTAAHEALIAQTRAAFEGDPRVLAMWVEGSVGRGTEDPWSDVDIHMVVADDAFDSFGPASDVLGRVGTLLGNLETALPGVRILPATIAGDWGLLRLDLYLERRSNAGGARHSGHRMLFDRDGVEGDLIAAPPLLLEPRPQLATLIRGFWFGGTWPRRFIGREDWGSLLMNDVRVIYEFVVPALLIADRSPEFYREPHNRARFLAPHRTLAINGLLGEALEAFAGIDRGSPDPEALLRFHEHFLLATWAAFRAACEIVDLDYPSEIENSYRDYYASELGVVVPELN